MGTLSFLTTIFAATDSQVEVNPRRCLRNRLCGNRCNLCLEICPSAALSYFDSSLHFDNEACSNCMGCTAACPVDALVPSKDPQQFVNQVKDVEHDTLIISCEHNQLFRKNELSLPCLGVFSLELLISVASAAPKKQILFNIEGCADCRNGRVSLWFQKNLTSLLQYGTARDVPTIQMMTDESGGQAQDDRRSFFKAMQSKAAGAAHWSRISGEKAKPQTSTSRTISSKNALLREVLGSNELPHPLASRMVPQMSIGESCAPCPRCAGICPTGALRLVRLEHLRKLEFDATSCCSCGLCLDFCKENALRLSCSLTD